MATGHQPVGGGQQRDVNTASLCRIGQETVQDIVYKTTEIFNVLKNTQLPNGVTPDAHKDKQAKLQEHMKNLTVLFKKLRLVYDKCNENCALMDQSSTEDLIPWMEDGAESKLDQISPNMDKLYFVKEERKEMIEKIHAKNHQLKDIMDQLRELMWDVNTMMMMSKTSYH
ncbi:mediator of RNA polymerase II transcription subunit 30-like [Glandiceps talaboti]